MNAKHAIDVNSASAEQLDQVPALRGHGPEIVRYREERGGFTDLRQLDEVPGLTGKTDGIDGAVSLGDQGPSGSVSSAKS